MRKAGASYVGIVRRDHYRPHILSVDTDSAGLFGWLWAEFPKEQDQYVGLSATEADLLEVCGNYIDKRQYKG